MNVSAVEPPQSTSGSHKRNNLIWLIAILLVASLALYAFGGFRGSSSTTSSQTTSTSYSVSAPSIVQYAAQGYVDGYNATSAGLLSPTRAGEESGAYAVLSQSQSLANITALVFDTTNSSQSYYDLFVSNVQGLAGFTDISSVLSGYQQYGSCYAYGEDVDGIAVANGVCRDGNVFLEAHLSSTEAITQAESDLSSLMGAMYQSVS